MRDIILLNCEQSKEIEENSSVQDNLSWGATAMAESKLSTGKVKVRQKNGTQSTVAYSDLPPGHWVLIETVTEVTDQYDSSKLTQTEWHQASPWNKYAKRVYSNGFWQSCPAGCTPIAVSQYMYYTHFKENIPSACVTSAILTSDGTDYEFSNPSEIVWTQMALSGYAGNTDYAALLIGYAGRQLNSEYKIEGTQTYPWDIVNFMNTTYPATFTRTLFDFSYVKSSLDNEYPILCSIYRIKENTENLVGHTILIDRYKALFLTTTAYYGYEREPWTGPGDDPWPDNDYDEDGNIIGYGITNEVATQTTSYQILMNWGWNPHSEYDEKVFIPDAENWAIINRNYNQGHYIYKRSDIK